MRIKIQELLKVTVFMLLLVISFFYVSDVLLWKTSADINLYNGKHFYENEENTIDVLFYGNSHCFCTINNAILYEDYGIASYNFSAGAQRIGSTYYFMKESLEYQKPKAMLVEICPILDFELSEGDVYRNVFALKQGENYYENVKYIDSLTNGMGGEVTDLIVQWPITHTRYAELEEEDYRDFHYFQRGFRASFANNVYEMPEASAEKGVATLKEEDIYYIDQMIQLAEENDIELIFYVAPYLVQQEDQQLYNAVEQYVKSKNITYFNFTTEENIAHINYNLDIWNTGHVNVYGAEKVTRYLGDYLKNNVDLPDRRGDEAYELWELDARYFKRLVQENNLQQSTDLDSLFTSLATLDNLCIITADGNWESSTAVQDKLEQLGLAKDEIHNKDVFIFAEGQLVDSLQKGDGRYYKEYNQKSVVITYLQDTASFDVNIGEPLPRMVSEGLNIYVYNEIDGTLLGVVGVTADGSLVQ